MSLSDIIEQFIMDSLDEGARVSISRNRLAQHFNCVPSQINYVLATRFTLSRGFLVESRRGGGGSVTIVRLDESPGDALASAAGADYSDGVTAAHCAQVLDRLVREGLLTHRERNLLLAVLSDRALPVDEKLRLPLRAHLFQSALIALSRMQDGGG